jgi:acyl-CoA thioester hydrolase
VTEPFPGAFDGVEHRLPVRVYYEDTDFTGVIYHAGYARFFERGRSDYLRLAGIDHRTLLEQDTAFVVTRLVIDFKRPARIDEALTIVTVYEQVKGPRMLIRQRAERNGDILAEGEVHAACIRLNGQPRRPPPELIAALQARMSPPGKS